MKQILFSSYYFKFFTGLFYFQHSNRLLELIHESKSLMRMGIQLPESAVDVLKQVSVQLLVWNILFFFFALDAHDPPAVFCFILTDINPIQTRGGFWSPRQL